MFRGRKQKRNKSRGEAGQTYCPLCGFEAEHSAAFETHLEERRHKYNYLLAVFRDNRSVCSIDYPVLFVYRTGRCCHMCEVNRISSKMTRYCGGRCLMNCLLVSFYVTRLFIYLFKMLCSNRCSVLILTCLCFVFLTLPYCT
jgi:hypothetical protein